MTSPDSAGEGRPYSAAAGPVNRAGAEGTLKAVNTEPEVLVLFCDAGDRWWQRLLKPGFRHCMVMIRFRSHWLACDSLWHGLEFHLLPAQRWNPVEFFRRRGFTVVAAKRGEKSGNMPILCPFTCVQVACRVLGVSGRWILTPWQLYKKIFFLKTEKKC